MAALTTAGVVLHDPIDRLEGDTRTSGWSGGLALAGYDRTAVLDVPAGPDPYLDYATSIPGLRSLGAGTAFARFADNVRLSPYVLAGANKLTSQEATAEGASGTLWSAVLGAATVAIDNTLHTEGSSSFLITTTAMSGGQAKVLLTRKVPVRGGIVHTVGWDIEVPNLFGSGNTYTLVRWYDIDGNSLGDSTVFWPAASGSFARAAGQVLAPARAVSARLGILSAPVSGNAGYTYNLDKGLLVEGATDGSYVAPTVPASMEGPYAGYEGPHLDPVRTAAAVTQGARSSDGLTFYNPVNTNIVTTPPVQMNVGNAAPRIQRNQRFGAQGVFFDDQGNIAHRTPTARFGANRFIEAGDIGSADVRSATGGMDLATLKAAGDLAGGARLRTGVAGVDLLVVVEAGNRGAARHNVGRLGADLLTLHDAGGYGGRNGHVPPADYQLGVPMFPDTYEDFWRSPDPVPWAGGVLSSPLSPPPGAAEWGYFIVPTGSIPSGQSFAGGTHTWVYYGFNNSVDASGGLYQGGQGQNAPAGDLYVYAYGSPNFLLTDPEPAGLPVPPGGVGYSPFTPGPTPTPARSGAEQRQPPANDNLRSFQVIQGLAGNTTFTDVAATLESLEPALGIGSFPFRGTVWFGWVPGWDGDITLAATGTALEIYKGPAPAAAEVVGVNNWRGDWAVGTQYQAGDRVSYGGKSYVASTATLGKLPSDPSIPGADLKVSGSVSTSSRDLALGRRVTLQPGTYFWIGDGGGGGYSTVPPDVLVGVTIGSLHGYGSTTWSTTSYWYPFALVDSTTGQEVASARPFNGGSFGAGYHQYMQFVLTAAVTFDTFRINASNYSPASTDTYGIATGIGAGFSGIAWATSAPDLNPWTEEPDSNPLTFANLTPLGAGSESVTTSVRNTDRFYVRAYPLGEAASGVTLAWSTHPSSLVVTISQPNLPSAPGVLNVSVAGVTPGASVDLTIDTDTTVLATIVADADGFATGVVAVAASAGVGAHLVNAHQVGGTAVGNAAFTVGTTEYAGPDPQDPPAPVVISPVATPIPRWRFQDPTNQVTWDFVINPKTADSVIIGRNLTPAHTTAPVTGQPIVFEGGKRAKRWTMTGDVFTHAQLNAIKAWIKPYRIYLTDDLGRTFVVKVLGVQSTPVKDTARPEHQTYVLTALLYGKVT